LSRYGNQRTRDHDRLDGASNFVIWKAKILEVYDKNRIKDYALKMVVVPVDVDPLKKYEEAQFKAKYMILVGFKDHVIPHIAEKDTAREMWRPLPHCTRELQFSRRCCLRVS